MSLFDIILLSVALGIDCFVVSFSQGLIFTSNRRKNSFNLALTMGLFQGLMPVIGYIGTEQIYRFLVPYSKYIAGGIFFILGLHFIIEAIKPQEDEQQIQCIGFKCLMMLGVATSIDALVSGSMLKLTSTDLLLSCAVIGFGSFIMSVFGFWIGNFTKKLPTKYMQITGGVILILLGIKALYH